MPLESLISGLHCVKVSDLPLSCSTHPESACMPMPVSSTGTHQVCRMLNEQDLQRTLQAQLSSNKVARRQIQISRRQGRLHRGRRSWCGCRRGAA